WGGVAVNWTSMSETLGGGERVGWEANGDLEPDTECFSVEKAVSTAARLGRRFSVQSQPSGDRQRLIVRGTVPLGRGSIAVWKKIDNPPLYFGYTLKRMLADHGVKVRGRARLGSVPPRSRLIHVSQSETFDLILKRLNKVSSNFVAWQLVKAHAAG